MLFFSAPLYCYFDRSLPEIDSQRKISLFEAQNSYSTLLWGYLLHRHGLREAVRIFTSLIRIYLRMQRFSQTVNAVVRTRTDLTGLNEKMNQAILFEADRISMES